jgi:hypothetical protein
MPVTGARMTVYERLSRASETCASAWLMLAFADAMLAV